MPLSFRPFAISIDGTERFDGSLQEGKLMKINMHEFNQYLGGLAHDDPVVRRKAASGLAKYSGAEWQGSPDAVSAAVPALVNATRPRGATPPDGPFRADAAKALGNIGAESPAIVAELLRLLKEDADDSVRTEAAHALGKIGERAETASRALAVVIGDPGNDDILRGEATWALARVGPLAPGTAAALGAAIDDSSGHVGVRAAEALWKVSGDAGRPVLALVARLGDPAVRQAAAQALNRIGPGAKGAVPALLVARKSKDRLFRESVVMALRRIDPEAAAKVGL
jgi:HEAT repeat protein